SRHRQLRGAVEGRHEISCHGDGLAHHRRPSKGIATSGYHGTWLEIPDLVQGRRPFAQMRIAAVAGRMILHEVTREHHIRVGDPGHDIARRMVGTKVEELNFALPEENGHAVLKGKSWPGQTLRNRACATEESWKAPHF